MQDNNKTRNEQIETLLGEKQLYNNLAEKAIQQGNDADADWYLYCLDGVYADLKALGVN